MKDIFKKLLFISMFSFLGASVFCQSVQTMYVKDKTAAVKTGPSLFAKTVCKLSYSNAVIVIEKNNSWVKIQVKSTNEIGWIKEKSLSSKKLVAKATGNAKEIALAGRNVGLINTEDESVEFEDDAIVIDAVCEDENISEETETETEETTDKQ